MKHYNVTIVRPPGYVHSNAFLEVAETVQHAIVGLGIACSFTQNTFLKDSTNIVFGGHMFPNQPLPPNLIIYNLEDVRLGQLDRYFKLAANYPVWDYSRKNMQLWESEYGVKAEHVPVGYMPVLSHIKSSPYPDIDVLFFGCRTDRRVAILEKLLASGINLRVEFGTYGDVRDDLIARAKVILNFHQYDDQPLEIVRVSYLLSNRKAVVCEQSVDDDEYNLRDGLKIVPYGQLVDACLGLVKDDTERARLEKRGFELFSAIDEREILRRVIA